MNKIFKYKIDKINILTVPLDFLLHERGNDGWQLVGSFKVENEIILIFIKELI